MFIFYSFFARKRDAIEGVGILMVAIGFMINIYSYLFPLESNDYYTVDQIDNIVFSKPTEIREIYTRYPFSFREDRVIYKTVD